MSRARAVEVPTIPNGDWSRDAAVVRLRDLTDFVCQVTNNSMLFLQPAVSKHRFISDLSSAAEDDPRTSYSPLKNNGAPTTARAGVAFPSNDWLASPDGDEYLANIGGSAHNY